MEDILDIQNTVAKPGYNRWLIPPAALAIHLSIGMAYGFSVFWLPLSKVIGVSQSAANDWSMKELGWIYTLFFVFLGSSAAIFGQWLEHNGPRKAGVVAAICWSGGFFISALGVYLHIFPLLLIGSGVIGGCGLGLGYISPVSTLIKWFPDKRGMATGMAIMGFGGGAMIGAPLADKLMKHYTTAASVGVWQTFVTLGIIYFIAMMAGAFSYRIPAPGWKPDGWNPPVEDTNAMITNGHVHVKDAHKAHQFWLLWLVLCLNVSASIGIIGMASPMLQEIFGGKLIGLNIPFPGLDLSLQAKTATIGAAFAGLLSLFNIAGRILWASLSDKIGRKVTYAVFFVLGLCLYIGAAHAANTKNLPMFISFFCLIISMYGGGFAAIPAYLSDLFGTQFVGAIHGRLLTAWSTAGVLGPMLVNYLRDYQIKSGVPVDSAYNLTYYILAGLLLIGFICNLMVKPLKKHHFMDEAELEKHRAKLQTKVAAHSEHQRIKPGANVYAITIIAWACVIIPLAWGISKTIEKAIGLFVR